MSLSATLFGRDSAIFRITNVLGLGIPGWLDKKFGAPETEGPRLEDLSVQTSTYGTDIPRLYGTVAMSGNLIWLENGKLKEVVKKKKSGGKGGGSNSEPTKTYTYFATFALALCEGPIAGIRRIWCSDKLIYNAGSDDLETIIASNKAAKKFTIYRGTDDQLPDPRYEASVGVGNAPAFRGLAYIVFRDFALADYSNTLQGAQFKVEVVSEGTSSVSFVESKVFTGPAVDTAVYGPQSNGAVVGIMSANSNWYDGAGTLLTDRVIYPGGNTVTKVTGPIKATLISGKYQACKYPLLFIRDGVLRLRFGADEYPYSDSVGDWVPTNKGLIILSAESRLYLLYKDPTENKTRLVIGYRTMIVIADTIILVRKGFTLKISADDLSVISETANSITLDGGYYLAGEGGDIYLCADNPGEFVNIYKLDAAALGLTDHFVLPPFNAVSPVNSHILSINNGLAIRAGKKQNGTLGYDSYALGKFSIGAVSMGAIIGSEVSASQLLDDEDIDVTEMNTSVAGYRVTGGSIRSALEPLQVYSPFDVVQSGYKIKFVPRGRNSVLTIPYSDLYAGDDGLGTVLEQPREMDSQLPSKVTVQYLDASREYAVTSQYYQRTSTPAVNAVEQELAIVMTADDAAKVAEIQTFRAWLERTSSSFSLPPIYQQLEPADVITIIAPDASYELRLGETNMTPEGRLECKAAPNRAALYNSSAVGGEVPGPDGTIGLPGASLFIPLDIPVVDETLQNAPGFVGVMTGYSSNWPGGLVVCSNDNGQTFTDLQAYQGLATIGYARGTLPVNSGALVDQRTLVVDLISGELDSITRDQMLAGANYAAYGADQRWEIVRFQNAVLQADGSYALSGFARGQRGTEWASGLHAAGDAFVLLEDPDNAFIGMPVESLGLARLYRGITAGDSIDDATDVNFTYRGVNLRPLSPVYPRGVRDSSGNLAVSATRRSRLSSSWWTNGVVAPVGETTESYEADVMSGTTVKRTISNSSPVFSYTAAQQVNDFGATQSSVTLRIYQLSSAVGRGYPLEVTL